LALVTGKLEAFMEDQDQRLVSGALGSVPPRVSPDFLSRVNARIDAGLAADGWFGLADYRAWTLRLVPAAGVLALIAILWPSTATAPAASTAQSTSVRATAFRPSSAGDWQRDVSANALLEAALQPANGDARVR
jgi:hypothetical protein